MRLIIDSAHTADQEACPDCGLAYVHDSPSDQRLHADIHDEVVNVTHDQVPGRGRSPAYSTCCHKFRATGITTYLENGGTLEHTTTQPASASRPTGNFFSFGAHPLTRGAEETREKKTYGIAITSLLWTLDLNSQSDLGRRPSPVKEMLRVRWSSARLQPLHRVHCPSAS